ncbi:Hypothetical protein Nlim_0663 [Candidatus Nitrosarchaeum limnium SFB1]|jgi:hypothetical protein|uniref:Uncharacterized protein n=1 Tax=Candidatus Nitrosarchaeum limnium SFB1 TaxID=886738 RepID=F3KJK5_9ARCH|nr:Hypothetical protein Nlim_0663 [Candidatus Nitrosarchaeum limnium SFB1]
MCSNHQSKIGVYDILNKSQKETTVNKNIQIDLHIHLAAHLLHVSDTVLLFGWTNQTSLGNNL